MKKHLLIAAAAAAILLPGVPAAVFAASPAHADEHHKFSAEDLAAFTDARVAALKAGLKLTSAQEKNWPALETALRDLAKAHAAQAAEAHEKTDEPHERRDPIEGLRERAKRLAAHSADLQKIADAAKPLYDSLDDAQKRRLGPLLHATFRGHGYHGWRHGEGHDGHSD